MQRITPVDIGWQPDKSAALPVYQQIVRFICQKVKSGAWPIGTRLPAQRQLAEMFGVNRSTIVAALDELTACGIAASNQGAGTVIVSNTWSVLLPNADWSAYLSSGYFKANSKILQAINHYEAQSNIIRLGTGESDPRIMPAEIYQEAMTRLMRSAPSLGYTEPLGSPRLRRAVAKLLEKRGLKVAPSCLLITSGSLQALQLIAAGLLPRGSAVYLEAPSYLKSLNLFQSSDIRLQGVPMDNDGISLRHLADCCGSSHNPAALYTIPTHHNPTGVTMPLARRKALLQLCQERQLPIIEDTAYEELSLTQPAPPSLKALDASGAVIQLGTISKSFSPGLRIGWLAAPEPIVQRLGDIKMQIDYGASALSQALLCEILESGLYEQYLHLLRQELKQRRENALLVLEKYYKDLALWNEPQGGFFIWLTFSRPLNMRQLFQEAIKRRILLNPGDIYDFKRNNSLRLSFAYVSCEEFTAAAKELAPIVRALQNTP